MNAIHEAVQEAESEVRKLKDKNKKLRQKIDAVKKENKRLRQYTEHPCECDIWKDKRCSCGLTGPLKESKK